MNKVSALAVLSNAVLVWNTVRMTEIVRALKISTGNAAAVTFGTPARAAPGRHRRSPALHAARRRVQVAPLAPRFRIACAALRVPG
jgi:hypothetical protein